jgi:hypothetical protein
MSSPARAVFHGMNLAETAEPHLSQEELDKLQEIHELLNLMMRDLSIVAQGASQFQANRYELPMLPAAPYAYSFYQFPSGMYPFLPPRHGWVSTT